MKNSLIRFLAISFLPFYFACAPGTEPRIPRQLVESDLRLYPSIPNTNPGGDSTTATPGVVGAWRLVGHTSATGEETDDHMSTEIYVIIQEGLSGGLFQRRLTHDDEYQTIFLPQSFELQDGQVLHRVPTGNEIIFPPIRERVRRMGACMNLQFLFDSRDEENRYSYAFSATGELTLSDLSGDLSENFVRQTWRLQRNEISQLHPDILRLLHGEVLPSQDAADLESPSNPEDSPYRPRNRRNNQTPFASREFGRETE